MKRITLVVLSLLAFSPALFAQQQAAAPASGNTSIVFFREGHYMGRALKPSVYVDGKQVARLENGRWFTMPIAPGKHEVSSSAKHEAATVVEVSAGETSYVQMVITTGNWRGSGRLIEVDSAEAKDKIAKLKPLDEKFLFLTGAPSQGDQP